VLDYLAELGRRLPLTLELGLQSDRDAVLRASYRGHDSACFVDGVRRAAARGIELCGHVILGLPGEGDDAPERLGRLLASLPLSSIKVHNLHIMRGTPWARAWQRGAIQAPDRERYLDLLIRLLRELRPDQYLQRVLADAPPQLLLSGGWCHDKQGFLRALRERLSATHR